MLIFTKRYGGIVDFNRKFVFLVFPVLYIIVLAVCVFRSGVHSTYICYLAIYVVALASFIFGKKYMLVFLLFSLPVFTALSLIKAEAIFFENGDTDLYETMLAVSMVSVSFSSSLVGYFITDRIFRILSRCPVAPANTQMFDRAD